MTPLLARFHRRANLRTVAATLSVAVLLNVVVAGLGRQIDDLRSEQLGIARFEIQSAALMGSLDGLGAGERVPGLGEDIRAFRRSVGALARASDDPTLRVEGDRLAASAEDQLAQTMEDARRTDVDRTHPSYRRLTAKAEALARQSAERVAQASALVGLATTATLLAGAGFVALLILRTRRKIDAVGALKTAESAAAAGERRLRALIQNSADVIAVVTADGQIELVSDVCEEAWGPTAVALVGTSILGLIDSGDRELVEEAIASGARAAAVEIGMGGPDGARRDFALYITNLLDDPDVGGVLLTFHDLTESKQYETEMAHRAFHDRLTGLPNRALFLDRLGHRLSRRSDGQTFAVLFIDLDNFKVVNDSLGHEAGDALLIEAAARLRTAVRPSDTVARLGGDEFTVILDNLGHDGPQRSLEIAGRIQTIMGGPSRWARARCSSPAASAS